MTADRNNKTKKAGRIAAFVLVLALIVTAAVLMIYEGKDMASAYSDAMRVYFILALFFLLVFYILYRYTVNADGPGKMSSKADIKYMIAVILALGFSLRLILSVTAPQCDIDVGLFKFWGTQISKVGITQAYEKISNIDYPPLYLYVLTGLGGLARVLKLESTGVYTMMVKLPSILADLGIAVLFYNIFLKDKPKHWALFFLAVWIFNPVAIIDSACWGQVDSILAFFILLGCYLIQKKYFGRAGLVYALGVLFKPQAIIALPILFYALIKNKKLRPWLYAAGTFISTFFLVSLPFWIRYGITDLEIFGIKLKLPWIFSLYMGTAGHYSYTTVNALNYWYLLGKNWVPDGSEFLGATYFIWGMISIVLISVLVMVFYLITKERPSLPYFMTALLLLVVVTFGPRMHERYFFPAVILILAVAVMENDKLLFGLYGALSMFGFMTVAEIMTDLKVGANDATREYYWPKLNMTRGYMALGNTLITLMLFAYGVIYTFAPKILDRNSLKIYKETKETEETVKEPVK